MITRLLHYKGMEMLMSEDWVHVDDVAEVALENGWVTEKQLAEYIVVSPKESFRKLQVELEKRGYMLLKEGELEDLLKILAKTGGEAPETSDP